MEDAPVFTDSRMVTETITDVETDHNDGTVTVATHEAALAAPMVTAIVGAFQAPTLQGYALDHAADPTCPYPHLADEMDRCPVIASYLKRDGEEHASAMKQTERAQDARDRQAAHLREVTTMRRNRRDEIARNQGRR